MAGPEARQTHAGAWGPHWPAWWRARAFDRPVGVLGGGDGHAHNLPAWPGQRVVQGQREGPPLPAAPHGRRAGAGVQEGAQARVQVLYTAAVRQPATGANIVTGPAGSCRARRWQRPERHSRRLQPPTLTTAWPLQVPGAACVVACGLLVRRSMDGLDAEQVVQVLRLGSRAGCSTPQPSPQQPWGEASTHGTGPAAMLQAGRLREECREPGSKPE